MHPQFIRYLMHYTRNIRQHKILSLGKAQAYNWGLCSIEYVLPRDTIHSAECLSVCPSVSPLVCYYPLYPQK